MKLRARMLPLALSAGLLPGVLNAAEDTLPPAQVKMGGAIIDVKFAPGRIDLGAGPILDWIKTAAEAVTEYYGRFPLPNPRILVRPAEGRRGIFAGTTYGYHGGFTRISVGQLSDQQELDGDWMMTHELLHMAFPDVEGEDREHHWIEEGMATYIEPIARSQIGKFPVEKVWAEMARYMPQGEPRDGDQGLDNTHSWGRTYWGGALYWLMADIQIRQRTNNRRGLQDAMRAILDAGGTIVEDWPVERVLEIGDRGTGGTVLADLYKRMKGAPVEIDLNDLWNKLGVQVSQGVVTFNDKAPLARIRKAITEPGKPVVSAVTKRGGAETGR